MGTNLFFEICENQSQPDIFGRKATVLLDYLSSQTKVLNLVPVKIKPRKPDIHEEQLQIKYNLKWDYDTLLQKWDDGTLELKDIIKDIKGLPLNEKTKEAPQDFQDENEIPDHVQVNVEKKSHVEDECSVRELQEDYQKLKLLARRPVRRKIDRETVEECENKYKQAYELHNLEKQVHISL